jgi:hypothetical protein
MQWCEQTLHLSGISTPLNASAFLQQHTHVVPDWYKAFLFRTRAHVAAGYTPALALAPKPDGESGFLQLTRRRIQILQQAGYSPGESIKR